MPCAGAGGTVSSRWRWTAAWREDSRTTAPKRQRGERQMDDGMQWLAEQLRGIRCLHQLAQVHHRDLIGEELHHRQVMGDKEIGQVELRLQILQQVQDLSLDGHVQRGHRLPAPDETGGPGGDDGNGEGTGRQYRPQPHQVRDSDAEPDRRRCAV